MDDIEVSEKGVLKLLQNLRQNKATGPDSIPAYILKIGAKELSPILTKIFQWSLDAGQVPSYWKDAMMVPIFKKGDKHQPANYRPISLTSITCKVLEHIIHSSVMKHLDRHHILSDAQHGFRKKRSCETQLLVTVHNIAKNLALGDQVDVILLDFSKAFDEVPHQRLLRWIQSFLTNRTQEVALEGTLSSSAPVLSGVPQGTVPGPLLFLTYINDLPYAVHHSSARLFADDSLLYRRIKDHQDQALLQQDLDSLEEWEHTWQMNFNTSKCNVIRIMPNKRRKTLTSNYSLHGQTLETTSTNRYLGINISSDLSWSNHVEYVAARGNRTMGFLRRNFRECTPKVKTTTYTTLVRPTLEYASAVWDPYKQNDAQLLENVQRRAARYMNNNYADRSPDSVTSML